MANTISDMFKMEDLRKKILFTLLILAITRIGTVIPVPGVNPSILEAYFRAQSSSGTLGIVEYLNFFSGGAFSNFSLFTLGVMPYISMQIIVQLLMLIIPESHQIRYYRRVSAAVIRRHGLRQKHSRRPDDRYPAVHTYFNADSNSRNNGFDLAR